MTHAWLVARDRKEHVKPALCPGEMKVFETRRHWVKGTVENVLKCDQCGAVLGLVGETVEWSMNASDWNSLGR